MIKYLAKVENVEIFVENEENFFEKSKKLSLEMASLLDFLLN